MKIANIYIRISGYLIQGINIHLLRTNSQHFILAAPVFHDISFDTYKQERFLIYMLSCSLYITSSLNRVKVEEISNIQC